ncbi:class II fructose-bisphosphate aldolase [Solirubrobacter ginsenosidimutans]|uniref:Class II fructose-bisphosphate aldolase n=1 Tax=Solirubrobacter ginsenosidimutans TaxID=490573 RepID=A0A9X3N076_9ACTN|nr:class II fructose-bisphosphate aldolase [Solirubrobacter ginsenosidimutans]MDA0162443.1 class II fructose-bisphosphate aldolase [Solirubrobacter ginsenosidimutans]
MLEPFAALLGRGRVGAFGCYDTAMAVGVLRALDARGGVILVPAATLRSEPVVAGLRAVAETARVPVCLQADHVHDLETIERACRWGVQAVMADGSPLDFEDNVAFVREAAAIARRHGVAVEGELGRLPGGADADAPIGAGLATDPEQAAEFVARTGVDCLAIALGNVHGALLPAPRDLDWGRLEAIRRAVGVPLALHGGTGLAPEVVARAVRGGIAKVNFNTGLRRAYLAATAAALPVAEPAADLVALHARQADAVEAAAREALVGIALAGNSDLVGRL